MCCVQAINIDEAFNSCNEVLEAEPENIDALCDRAETYINNEQYEEGMVLNTFCCIAWYHIKHFKLPLKLCRV